MPNRRMVISHNIDRELFLIFTVKYLLRMLAGIWFTHNYLYHKPRYVSEWLGCWGGYLECSKIRFARGRLRGDSRV